MGARHILRDCRCGFGEYAQAVTLTLDDTMYPRTEDYMVMLPTGNRTGSVKVPILNIGPIVTDLTSPCNLLCDLENEGTGTQTRTV